MRVFDEKSYTYNTAIQRIVYNIQLMFFEENEFENNLAYRVYETNHNLCSLNINRKKQSVIIL